MELQTNRNEAAPFSEENETFRIVTIYDSERSSGNAALASGLVEEELGGDIPVDKSFWRVDSLDSRSLRHRAAEEAAVADMIILAIGARTDVAAVKEWVQLWQKGRRQEGGLITLLDETHDDDLRDFLAEAALTANMDFLSRSASGSRMQIS